jgi:hypothetical protein
MLVKGRRRQGSVGEVEGDWVRKAGFRLSRHSAQSALFLRWQRLTLPHRVQCSTISACGLNDRVRDGAGCTPTALATNKRRLRLCLVNHVPAALTFPLRCLLQNPCSTPFGTFTTRLCLGLHISCCASQLGCDTPTAAFAVVCVSCRSNGRFVEAFFSYALVPLQPAPASPYQHNVPRRATVQSSQ